MSADGPQGTPKAANKLRAVGCIYKLYVLTDMMMEKAVYKQNKKICLEHSRLITKQATLATLALVVVQGDGQTYGPQLPWNDHGTDERTHSPVI